MSRKDFKRIPLRSFDDMPQRTFDLLPRFVEKFWWKDCIFAGKVNGQWVKVDGSRFVERTNRISMGLMKLGVQKGDRIAIVSNNCPQWNMVDFAAQQIGAIVVPVYPTLSQNDFEYIFHHSEPKIIFLEGPVIYRKIKDVLEHVDAMIYTFNQVMGIKLLKEVIEEGFSGLDLRRELRQIESEISPDDVATIIYTSGTLGTPKGVMLTHRNLMSNCQHYAPHYPIEPTQKAISYLPLSHILERSVQYSHIYLGVSTYYVENIGTIMRDVADIKPEHFSTVPRVLEKAYVAIMRKGEKLTGFKKKTFDWAFALADKFDETGRNNGCWYKWKLGLARILVFNEVKKTFGGNLRFFISGGASIQPRLVRIFAAMGMPVSEGYGLTETSPVVCTNSLATGVMKAGTVGIPCANLEVKTDPESGEILVKGPSVMKGYYKNEEQTKLAIDENGFFHTGDKGEFDEDGLLKITGRIKEIFKDSMGKYISPALIENKFAESVWFSNMMVVGENQKFAAALIVPNFDYLRQWCKEQNIEYKTDAEMVKNKAVVAAIRKEVEAYNKFFGDYEQIKRFELMDHDWTVDEGEMTASMKIRRKVIAEHYKDSIERLFAE